MTNPLKPFLVLLVFIVFLFVMSLIAPTILGPLGEMAKASDGSNGDGFSVNDSTIDNSARIAIVDIPSLMLGTIGVWAFLALLAVLAYSGVI